MPVRRTIRALKGDLAAARVKGSFARNALYTFGEGLVNILAQAILSPIVAKIYGPAAYGVYGLFSSITSNLANAGGLGYTPAVLLPKEEDRAVLLLRLNLLLVAALVLITLPLFLFPAVLYRLAPNWAVMGNWCMLIPLMTLVLAVNQALIAWSMRMKAFSFSAKNNSVTILALRLVNLGIGLVTKGATWGLVLSDTLVRGCSAIAYVLGLRKYGLAQVARRRTRSELWAVALEYKEYPRYVFPARYLNLFALQLPIFGLTTLGDTAMVGNFTLAGSILLMPLRLLGYSLSTVFFRKAAEIGGEDPARLGDVVQRMYLRLRLLGVLPFIFLIFFGDLIFHLVLGPEWALAGAYCGVMGPFYLFRLLSEPIASVYNAQRDERALFHFNLWLFIGNAAAVVLGVYFFRTAVMTVLLFAVVNTVAYMLQSVAILRRTGLPAWRMTLTTIGMAIASAAVFMALRKGVAGTWWPTLW